MTDTKFACNQVVRIWADADGPTILVRVLDVVSRKDEDTCYLVSTDAVYNNWLVANDMKSIWVDEFELTEYED